MVVTGFAVISLISILVIVITSLITYEILGYVWNLLPRLTMGHRVRVLFMIIPIFAAHIINIWVYALAYFLVEHYMQLGHLIGPISAPSLSYESFVDRLYFSATTYTSLGFGDILPAGDLRMLSSAEVLNGLVMIGWTVSLTYLAMEKFWALPRRGGEHSRRSSDA